MIVFCENCHSSILTYPSRVKRGSSRFCSRKCWGNARKGKPTWLSTHKAPNSGRTRFKKGFTPWNKGIHTGIRPWLGKTRSEEVKKKISEHRRGLTTKENHPQWKGGITPLNLAERVRFRRTIQKEVFKRDSYTCQICGIKGVPMTVDHIQSWSEYIELRFDMNNCRTLCEKCHYEITYGKPMPEHVKTWGHNFKKGVEKFA